MKIELDLEKFSKQGQLKINEYIALQLLFTRKATNIRYIRYLGYIDYNDLQARGWVKHDPENDSVILREKTLSLFRVSPDVFKEFFTTYPMKTPSGRILRTEKTGTVLYKQLLNSWNNVFKGKPDEAVAALKALKNELAFRNANDSLDFMVGIAKWVSDGHYQNTYDTTNIDKKEVHSSFEEL